MDIIVQKFGGATLSDINKIKLVAKRICELKKSKNNIIIIVSAMGKTTDSLIWQSYDLSPHPDQRELDVLLSTGEIISSAFLAIALNELGCPAVSFNGSQAGIMTDEQHSNANIQAIEGHRISRAMKKGKVVILAGFQGIDYEGDITTLGRGGSDTTALAIAAHFQAERCEILKDVPAIYSADPKVVADALPITKVSYDQLLDMTFWGAKVLQYRSVEIAKKYKVPLYVGPAHTTENGTTVEDIPMIESSNVIALNSHENVLRIHSPLKTLSESIDWLKKILLNKNIPFPQLLHTERAEGGIDMFLTAPIENLGSIANEMGVESIINEGLCSVTTTCQGATRPELLEKVVNILEKNNIKVFYMMISSMSLTVFIEPIYRIEAIKSLHRLILPKHLKTP
jgi:aspartate kinase